MSRKITLYLGPGDANDDKRLLNATLRAAQPGDDVTLVRPSSPAPEAVPSASKNEPLETKVGTGVDRVLEASTEAAKAEQRAASTESHEQQAKKRAQGIKRARDWLVKLTRDEATKMLIRPVLIGAWAAIVKAAHSLLSLWP